MIVEDDPLVLITAAEALRDAGFTVIEAETADEAAAILQSLAEDVRVVFSDIELPGALNGLALARIVGEAWPDIAVLLTSGRIHPAPSDLPKRTLFLPKPYSVAHVATLVVQLAGS